MSLKLQVHLGNSPLGISEPAGDPRPVSYLSLLCFILLELSTLLVMFYVLVLLLRYIHVNSFGLFLLFFVLVSRESRDISSMPSLLFQFDLEKRDIFATSFINIVPWTHSPIFARVPRVSLGFPEFPPTTSISAFFAIPSSE